jgi:hypothetical protein
MLEIVSRLETQMEHLLARTFTGDVMCLVMSVCSAGLTLVLGLDPGSVFQITRHVPSRLLTFGMLGFFVE